MCKKKFSILSLAIVLAAGIVFIAGLVMAGDQQNTPSPPFLDKLLPTWSQKLFAAQRFVLVLDGQGVLDKETGLVWERSPSISPGDWWGAQDYCKRLTWGNRMGWRLPTIEELASLVDPSVPYPGPTLPSGHPFTGVQQWKYWSATTCANPDPDTPPCAWGVDFDRGGVDTAGKFNGDVYRWCVRGGQGVDPQ